MTGSSPATPSERHVHVARISYLQTEVTYTVADGDHTFTGGAFSLFTWVLLVLGTVAIGRLWRALPRWRRRRAAAPAHLS